MSDERPPLTIVGAPDAMVCEGDVCFVPAQQVQHDVNRLLDDDAV